MLALIERRLPEGGHVIDYGCGSGRYLLALGGRAAIAAGFDICRSALARFRQAIAQAGRGEAIHVLGPDPAEVERHVARHGKADLVLCLFGVLSHIEGREERRRTLVRLAALLKPGSGRLILSVPNRRRRFRRLQRALPPGRRDEVRYVRSFEEGSVELSYKLFDVATLRAELRGAGLELERVGAESLLPETVIGNSRILRRLDRLLDAAGAGVAGLRPAGGGPAARDAGAGARPRGWRCRLPRRGPRTVAGGSSASASAGG